MSESFNYQIELGEDVCPSCEEKVGLEIQTEKRSSLSNKAYKVLSLVPTISFAVYTVFMFIFMAFLPVASISAFGLSEKFGTISSATRFNEIAGLNLLSIILLVVFVIALFYTILLLQHRFSVLKYRAVFGKPLNKRLEAISIVFILAYVVLAVAVIAKVLNADDGLRIIKVGSFAILTVILSILCLLAIVISISLCNAHEKANPEILQRWKQERVNAKEKAKNAKAKKVAKGVGKIFSKKILMVIIPLVLILAIGKLNVTNLTERLKAQPFVASDLKQIVMDDAGKFELSKASIEVMVGSPYVAEGSTEDKNNAVYYTENYVELLKKAERNQKYTILAIEQGDYRISGLLKQAKDIETEVETLAYGQAQITYDDYGRLKEVVYNNVVIDGFTSIEKKLDKIQIFKIIEVDSAQNSTTKKIDKIIYIATYADGSFIYRTCENAVVVLEDQTVSTTYEGSYVGKTIKWQDAFGKYEIKGA